jgi:hypothetical protein
MAFYRDTFVDVTVRLAIAPHECDYVRSGLPDKESPTVAVRRIVEDNFGLSPSRGERILKIEEAQGA